jgi:hypothetical protein
VLLILVGQFADLFTFTLVIASEVPGTEAGPLGSVLLTLGPGAVVCLKLLAIAALGLGGWALRHRTRLLSILAMVGFLGATMNLLALVTA